MELLPIIYWTLVGVGLLSVIVITFSYISFHVRKKMGNIPSTEVTGYARDKKIKITNPDKKPASKKPHHPKVQTLSKYKDYEDKKKKKKTSLDKRSNDELYKKPTRDEKKSRIEIINVPKDDKEYYTMGSNNKRDGWN